MASSHAPEAGTGAGAGAGAGSEPVLPARRGGTGCEHPGSPQASPAAPTGVHVACATARCPHTPRLCPLLLAARLKPTTRLLAPSNALIRHPQFSKGILDFLDPRSLRHRLVGVQGLPRPLCIEQGWSQSQRGREALGSVVWESSMAVANFMSLHFPHGWWRGKRVVELGCGAGAVVGITAGALGASVVCTDMPAIVRQAARNVSVNAGLCGRNVVAAPYLWGVPPADAGLRGKYDVVMAADVIYNNDDVHDALLSSLVALCSASTLLVIGYKQRLIGTESPFFHSRLPAAGFHVRIIRVADLPKVRDVPDSNWLFIVVAWKTAAQDKDAGGASAEPRPPVRPTRAAAAVRRLKPAASGGPAAAAPTTRRPQPGTFRIADHAELESRFWLRGHA